MFGWSSYNPTIPPCAKSQEGIQQKTNYVVDPNMGCQWTSKKSSQAGQPTQLSSAERPLLALGLNCLRKGDSIVVVEGEIPTPQRRRKVNRYLDEKEGEKIEQGSPWIFHKCPAPDHKDLPDSIVGLTNTSKHNMFFFIRTNGSGGFASCGVSSQ